MKNNPSQPGTNATDAQWMQWADDEAAIPAAGDDGADGGGDMLRRGDVVGRVVSDLGQVVRAHYDAAADKNDDDVAALWASIAGELATPTASRPVAMPAGTAAPSTGWWRYALTGLASAALASVLTFAIVRQGGSPTVATSPARLPGGTQVGATPVDPTSAEMIVPAIYRQPPTVETLDVATGSGTVITVEDPEGNAAIIWVTPNDIGELQ